MDLTLIDFYRWLAEHDPQAPVGIARRAEDTPLARYMRERSGVPHFVMRGMIGTQGMEDAVALPAWAVEFCRMVDDYVFTHSREVTAQQAMAHLDYACLLCGLTVPLPRETEQQILG